MKSWYDIIPPSSWLEDFGQQREESLEAVVHRDEVEKSLRLSPQMGVGEGDAFALPVRDADSRMIADRMPPQEVP
ncbi:MAG: hypothetical protein U9R72_10505 [Chloroflexota bacterium]|nr:hypothetical protein [Chloroflexota bacterium]